MSRHEGSVKGSIEPPIVYRGTCRCGAQGPLTGSRADADLWIDQHLIAAARAQAHRTMRQPTLEDQIRYYREQEAKTTDPNEKALWAALAGELEHRTGQHDVDWTQPPIF